MKKNYLFTLLLTLCFSVLSFGQTTLTAGDIVIIEMQGDGTDGFRFVPLVDLEAGTTIRFTDNGWTGTAIRSGEGTVLYTAPSGGITKGTNIRYDVTGSTDFAVDGNNLNISSSGDQILAYQGETASPTFLFAAAGNSTEWQTESNDSNQTDLPQGLTDGVNAITIGSNSGPEDEFDNIYYTGITTGTKDVLLAAVANAGNWEGNNSSSSPITTIFTINEPTTDPSLTITSPSNNQAFSSSTGNIPVNFNIQNFTLSGDDGQEMTDNTGDGYILTTIYKNDESDGTANIFSTTGPEIENAEPGAAYVITAELVDNAGASLNPKVESTVTFYIEFPCDIEMTTILTTCDATTSDLDTYTATIDFTGGNTGTTYTITAVDSQDANIGSLGGDNPNTADSGQIIISEVPEGTDFTLKVVGGLGSSCDLTRSISSPTCYALPISEDFSYADGSLTSNPLWDSFSGTSGDLMVTSGQALVQHGTPSEDVQILFTAVSGSVYYAFDFTVVDPGSIISGNDNEYFAMFKDASFAYRAKLDIVPPTSSGDFTIGIATTGNDADAIWATDFTYGVTYRVTVMYNQDSNIAQLWVDATSDSDTSISGEDLDDPGLSIEAFAFRQSDSDLNEGILVDNLSIGTTFAETVLSIGKIEIEGFATYPNPVTNQFTISSSSADTKQVSIFNVIGKRVFSTSISGTKSDVDVSSISSGLYILKVTEGNSISTSKLVIK